MRCMITIVACLLMACSKPTAEEYFAAAEAFQRTAEAELGSKQSVQDSLFNIAIFQFEELADEYPGHPLAQASLFRVAELHNNGTRDFPKSIAAYRRLGMTYSETPQAPLSLFMMGFLYNNELKNFDSAGAVYRRFIERFPEHELTSSARAELENLGKSPEEIIERQVALSKEIESGSEAQTSAGKKR